MNQSDQSLCNRFFEGRQFLVDATVYRYCKLNDGFIEKTKKENVYILATDFPPVQTWTVWTRHATFTKLNHPHFPHIPFIRRNFCSVFCLFLCYLFLFFRTATLWNKVPSVSFPEPDTPKRLKSKVNRYPHNLHFVLPLLSLISDTSIQ